MRSPFATLAALPFLLMQEGSIEVGECTHPCVLQTSFKVPSYVTKLWMVIQKTKSVQLHPLEGGGVVEEKTSTTQALSVHCGNMYHALAIAHVRGNGSDGCTSNC